MAGHATVLMLHCIHTLAAAAPESALWRQSVWSAGWEERTSVS